MIVTCERCKTQFQLDDSRVSEPGVLVRCSRCKHAFVVKPPEPAPESEPELEPERAGDAGLESVVDHDESTFDWQFDNGELTPSQAEAAEVRDEESAYGDVALEAEDSLLDLETEPAEPAAAEPGEVASDFAADPDDAPRAAAPDALDPVASPAALDRGRDEDELGSPGEWDILDEARAPVASRAAPLRVETLPRRPSDPLARRWVPEGWLGQAGGVTGWLALAGLCALGLVHGLFPAAPVAAGLAAPAPGLAFEDVRGRFVDNARVGDVYVVSGRLRNQRPGAVAMPALELVLRDAQRRPVGDPIPVGGPKPTEQLREAGHDELVRPIPMLLGVEPGATRSFEAVAWPLPREAESFELRLRAG